MRILVALLLLVSSSLFAAIPEKGMWWNPSESGRGYGIDVQDDIIFITYYGYDENGRSTFFTSLGVIDPSTDEITADWVEFSGGQCWGCNYSAPTSTNRGSATLKFDTAVTGTISLNNGPEIPIQRQLAVGFNPAHALLGTWHLTYGALGSYFGDVLWLNNVRDEDAGEFSGVRVGGGASRILVGGPDEDNPYTVSILLDSSASYYTFFYFTWSPDKIAGRTWTFLKTSSLSGSGLPLFGSRLYGENMSNSILKSNHENSIDKSSGADEDTAMKQASKLGGSEKRFFISGIEYSEDTMSEIASRLKDELNHANK